MEEEERNKQLGEVKAAEDERINEMLTRCGLQSVYLMVDRLWADDTDGMKLQRLPGVETLTSSFKEQLQNLVEELIEQGKSTFEVLDNELKDAQRGLKACRKVCMSHGPQCCGGGVALTCGCVHTCWVFTQAQASDRQSTALVSAFQKKKKHMLAAALKDGDGDPTPGSPCLPACSHWVVRSVLQALTTSLRPFVCSPQGHRAPPRREGGVVQQAVAARDDAARTVHRDRQRVRDQVHIFGDATKGHVWRLLPGSRRRGECVRSRSEQCSSRADASL